MKAADKRTQGLRDEALPSGGDAAFEGAQPGAQEPAVGLWLLSLTSTFIPGTAVALQLDP